MKKTVWKTTGVVVVLLVLMALVSIASISIGSRVIPFADVIGALLNPGAGDFTTAIVLARVPRTVFSLLAGAALGVSGLLMQSVTRNPIADPSILGVNSGASLFVVCGIAFFGIATAGQYISFAIVGAALTALLVYGVGSAGGNGATPLKLALAGTAVSTALSSLVSIIMLPRDNVMVSFRFWQIGSVSGAGWDGIQLFLPFFAVGVIIALAMAPSLEIMALGDDAAVGLGAKPGLIRLVSSLAAVVLCGATTAVAGPIGFIGLMVPHMVRLLFKGSLRASILLSALAGGLLLTFSDVIGRLVSGTGDVEVGIVTAIIGAPVFIFIAIHSTRAASLGEVKA